MTATQPGRIARFFHTLGYYLKGTYRRFMDEDILLYSSAIAFNCVLCVIPLLLLLTSILGLILSSSGEALLRVDEFLKNAFPSAFPAEQYSGEIRSTLQSVINDIINNRTTFGIFGAIVLTWTASSLFGITRAVLNHIFRIKSRKLYVLTILEDILWVIAIGILFFVTNLFFWILSLFQTMLADLPAARGIRLDILADTLPTAAVIGLAFIMFYIVYQFIPDTRVARRSALLAATTTTTLWVISGILFQWYLATFHSYSRIYGTYAFLLVFLIWVEISSIIFIIGGIVGQLYRERHPLAATLVS